MPPPVGFDFETAKEILRLVKKNKNGSLNRPIDSETPNLNNPQMVFAVVPELQSCTYDDDIEAWLLPTAISYLPFNIGTNSVGKKQFGPTDNYGIIDEGFAAKVYMPKLGSEPFAYANTGYHIGFIFGFDETTEDALVLIARQITLSGSATVEVVTDVTINENSELTVSTVSFAGTDYDQYTIRNFLALNDVFPSSYTANQGRVVKVNDSANGLTFGPIVDAEYTTFIALSDTPASYGASKADAYKSCIVGSNGVAIVFSAVNVITTNSIEGGGNPHHDFVDIKLVGDTASPATDTFYGVDGNGDRAWRTIEITSLSDLPATLVGSGEYFLKVNAGETGIEFVAVDIQQILDDIATLQADYITLEARVTALE